jgi:hypothetical protein
VMESVYFLFQKMDHYTLMCSLRKVKGREPVLAIVIHRIILKESLNRFEDVN